MAFRKIPVNAQLWSNAEDGSKVLVAEQRRDVLKDLLGATVKRPGLTVFNDDLPAPSKGQYYWQFKDKLYMESSGDLYSLTESGTLTLEASGIFAGSDFIDWSESTNTELVTSGAVRKLFMASGGPLGVYNGSTGVTLTGANDPKKATHVSIFDTYAMANETGQAKFDESVLHSDVADPITFTGKFFSAENNTDVLVALHTAWDEIALFGRRSIENFYNDGDSPFAQIPGGSVPIGTNSPWTIKFTDNSYFFLSHDRRLVRVDGRQPTVLSLPIDDILADAPGYDALKKAEAEVITLGGKALYLLTIDGRTFVYDYALKEWVSEWGTWNKNIAKYKPYPARNFVNIEEWGVTLCTDRTSGIVYKLDDQAYQDNGHEIRSSVITGHIDHGTGREKRSNELRLKLRRGEKVRTAVGDIAPVLIVRWRDNGSKVWSNDRQVNLGFQGDDEFFFSMFQLGAYRTRQYEFYFTDNVPLAIVDAEEDVELMR